MIKHPEVSFLEDKSSSLLFIKLLNINLYSYNILVIKRSFRDNNRLNLKEFK